MAPNLCVQIGKTKLKNPIMVASGTFGHAKEFEKLVDLKKLGAIVSKTITLKPRLGNPAPRIVETPSGMLNAIGLQNPGVEGFIQDKLPYLRKVGAPFFVSVMAYSVEEMTALITRLEKASGFDGYEINLSCPNVSYGNQNKVANAPRMFAHDPKLIQQVISAVRKKTRRTVIAKLGPDVSDIGLMARSAETAGADCVSLINTFMAMAIDIRTAKPVLGNKTGGLSGPCIKPIAVRMVWECAKKIRIPIIGIGGIANWQDTVEFLIAGATAVQVGTANFWNPGVSVEILSGLSGYLREKKISNIKSLIGSVVEK